MQENEISVRPTGLWIRTSDAKVNKWRKQIKETLKFHGYRLLGSTPLKDSHHMSFYHENFETFESLVVNSYKTGHIEIKTKMVDFMLENIVPQLEERLGTKLQWGTGDEQPCASEFLGKGEEYSDVVGQCLSMKPWLPLTGRRTDIDEIIMKDISDISPLTITDLARVDSQLISAREELEELNSAVCHLNSDLQTFDDKSKNSLRKCFDDTFQPGYYVSNVDAFQRYLEAKRERRTSCPAPSTE